MNQNALDQACQISEVNIIFIDFSEKLPFRLKQPMVKAAIKRGVFFEITYSGLISDVQSRREMISNCKRVANALRRKQFYKEAVQVEEIPSGRQSQTSKICI